MTDTANPIHPMLAPLAHVAKEVGRARSAESPKRLTNALRLALRQSKAWLRPEHRVGDPNAYMRHLLYTDADGDFVITAIVWLPGQQSAMHGHRVWCAFGVAEGELTEEQFLVAPGQPAGPLKTNVYAAGDIAEQDLDCKLVHRVSNKGTVPMVSLHLYGVSGDKLTTGINRVYG
jgi:predicted metal-dependent enzyme (double-stranded beta helix superfamily)